MVLQNYNYKNLLRLNNIKAGLYVNKGGGEGGKALTMTMTPWNLTHGQWSKNLTMTTDILESAGHGQWSKWLFCGQTSWFDQRFTISTIENLYFVHGHGQNWCFLVKFHGKILG